VPTISTFYGIVVKMFYSDHSPPHFHVKHGGEEAQVAIATGEMIGGQLSPRAARMVRGWAKLHREELDENWRRARKALPLKKVEPLT
jgi:Domain of unknown function (DUF4160)